MPGYVVGLKGRAACQDMASPVLCPSAYGAVVIGGWVGVSCIWHLPSVGQLLVPEFAPSGPVHLHFKGPWDGGGSPEVVANLWEDLGESFKPHSGIDSCEVLVGGVQEEGEIMFDVPAKVGGRPPGGESTIGEVSGLDGGPVVMCVGCFSCGVMNVDFGGVSGRLLGQGVRLLIARDARVRSDFVEVSGGSMADPTAEKHL